MNKMLHKRNIISYMKLLCVKKLKLCILKINFIMFDNFFVKRQFGTHVISCYFLKCVNFCLKCQLKCVCIIN